MLSTGVELKTRAGRPNCHRAEHAHSIGGATLVDVPRQGEDLPRDIRVQEAVVLGQVSPRASDFIDELVLEILRQRHEPGQQPEHDADVVAIEAWIAQQRAREPRLLGAAQLWVTPRASHDPIDGDEHAQRIVGLKEGIELRFEVRELPK